MAARHKAYRNLNRRDGIYYSLSFRGKVIGHRQAIVFRDATMKQPTDNALARVRGGRREVCSWILGTLDESSISPADIVTADMRRLVCDPKRVDHFSDAATGDRVDVASLVVLNGDGAFFLP